MEKLISKSFLWMFVGLLLTFATGYYVSTNEMMTYKINSTYLYLVFAFVEIILVVVLAARINKMKSSTAICFFILYSIISGLTFSSIFIYYKLTSILYVFIIAAVLFLVFGLIGYFTKIDLSRFGTCLLMALFGTFIAYLINMFIGSESFDMGITIISILIFVGFVAFDIQRAKNIDVDDDSALPILIALDLYLDFINIFLDLLRLFGNSDN